MPPKLHMYVALLCYHSLHMDPTLLHIQVKHECMYYAKVIMLCYTNVFMLHYTNILTLR